jgi:hypothetical protein
MINLSYIPLGSTQTIRSTWFDDEWEDVWNLYEEQKPQSFYIVIHLSLNATNEEILIVEHCHADGDGT